MALPRCPPRALCSHRSCLLASSPRLWRSPRSLSSQRRRAVPTSAIPRSIHCSTRRRDGTRKRTSTSLTRVTGPYPRTTRTFRSIHFLCAFWRHSSAVPTTPISSRAWSSPTSPFSWRSYTSRAWSQSIATRRPGHVGRFTFSSSRQASSSPSCIRSRYSLRSRSGPSITPGVVSGSRPPSWERSPRSRDRSSGPRSPFPSR